MRSAAAQKLRSGNASRNPADEGLDVLLAAARFVERVMLQHIRRCQIVDDAEIAGLAPELGKPVADDVLVFTFLAHFLSP
jgi:hypothetical protein